jgi:hypothetical protein
LYFVPATQLSAAEYEALAFTTEPAASYASAAVPALARWTALTLADMTGQARRSEPPP